MYPAGIQLFLYVPEDRQGIKYMMICIHMHGTMHFLSKMTRYNASYQAYRNGFGTNVTVISADNGKLKNTDNKKQGDTK